MRPKSIIFLLFILTLLAVSASAAPIAFNFAQFADDSTSSFIFTNGSTSTFTANTTGDFKFTKAGLSPDLGTAWHGVDIELYAETDDLAQTSGNSIVQGGLAGYIAFTLQSPVHGKSLLLKAEFDRARLTTNQGSEAASMLVSLPAGDFLKFSSDFIDVNKISANSSGSLSLTPVMPAAGITDGRLSSFTASSTGAFAGSPVPEPMTFAVTGAGLFGIALFVRRRV